MSPPRRAGEAMSGSTRFEKWRLRVGAFLEIVSGSGPNRSAARDYGLQAAPCCTFATRSQFNPLPARRPRESDQPRAFALRWRRCKPRATKGKAPVNIVMKLVGLGIALALIPNTSLGARAMADAAFGKLNVKVLVNVYGTSVAKLGMLVLACISRVPTVGMPAHIRGPERSRSADLHLVFGVLRRLSVIRRCENVSVLVITVLAAAGKLPSRPSRSFSGS
jgi:hypothetical protein